MSKVSQMSQSMSHMHQMMSHQEAQEALLLLLGEPLQPLHLALLPQLLQLHLALLAPLLCGEVDDRAHAPLARLPLEALAAALGHI